MTTAMPGFRARRETAMVGFDFARTRLGFDGFVFGWARVGMADSSPARTKSEKAAAVRLTSGLNARRVYGFDFRPARAPDEFVSDGERTTTAPTRASQSRGQRSEVS